MSIIGANIRIIVECLFKFDWYELMQAQIHICTYISYYNLSFFHLNSSNKKKMGETEIQNGGT